MKLRSKIVILFTALLLGVFLVTAFLVTYLVRRNFAELERQDALVNVTRLENAFENRLEALAGQLDDWTMWDDAYYYLQTQDQTFIDKEVTVGLMRQLKMNVIAHLTMDGEPVSVRAVVADSDSFDQVLADAFDRTIRAAVAERGSGNRWTAVISVQGYGPFMVSASPVLKSDGSGPPSGVAVFARFLDGDVVDALAKAVMLKVTGFAVSDPALPNDMQAAYRSMVETGQYEVRDLSDDIVAGYLVVNDAHEKPTVVLRLEMDRQIARYGQRSLWMLLALLLASFTVFLVLLFVLLGRIVVSPLERISDSVRKVCRGVKLKSSRMGDDEISYLEREICDRINELQEANVVIARIADEMKMYKLAVDSVSDMLVIADADFRIASANPAAEKVSGHAPAELVGRDALDFWSSSDEATVARIGLGVNGHDHAFRGEIPSVRKDERRYVAETSVFPIAEGEAPATFYVGITRDVTEAKEIDRMKTEFVSVASHQLKSPLTSIRWLTELLMEDDKRLKKGQRDALLQLYEVNGRLIGLVNDLLSVSRIDTGRKFEVMKKKADLVKTIRDVTAEQSIGASMRHVAIVIAEGIPKTLKLEMDEEKMRQVIMNLVNNAVKYSPDGQEVEIHVDEGVGEALVSVTDRGIGIPEKDQGHLFEKFFRAGNVADREGNGLGLYIVKAIVEKHGGRIWFESKEGAGTTFRFTIPKE